MERKEQSCEDRGEGGHDFKHRYSRNRDSEVGTNMGVFLRIEARDMWLQPSEWARSGDRALEIYETQRPWECGQLWVSLTQRK